MCRLLAVQSENEFSVSDYLKSFAQIAQSCEEEYQGHGWGCSYRKNGKWKHYKNIKPVWEDDLSGFRSTRLLLAHARSAFRDEGIVVENNMPFYDAKYVFIFNGELHGVKAKAPGRIGAEKVFNYVKRFDKGDMLGAIRKGVEILTKKTRFVRAMNFIIADTENMYVTSCFNESPDYFTLYNKKYGGTKVICSQPFPGENDWNKFENNTTVDF
jgi:predicted glutamine amidotransferase